MADPEPSAVPRTVSRDVTATEAEILTLHRYFIWQTRMREHFYDRLAEETPPPPEGHIDTETFMYMSYWYAALYVLVEGWRELGLHDE
jgi:hypothetical protein